MPALLRVRDTKTQPIAIPRRIQQSASPDDNSFDSTTWLKTKLNRYANAPAKGLKGYVACNKHDRPSSVESEALP